MELKNCVFCDFLLKRDQILFSSKYFFCINDNFPVNKGHTLIIPKRHQLDLFALNTAEWEDLFSVIQNTKNWLDKEVNPDGYNIGVNCGAVAGQTVFHLHLHVIPRFKGDVDKPRGGIRNLKKPLVDYPEAHRNESEMANTKKPYATYHVGLKVLIKKGDNYLFLKNPDGKLFDLPGGRIDEIEHTISLPEIIAREVREELGDEVKYKLGKPLFNFRRHIENKGFHIFLTVYEADYLSGEISLSPEHSKYEWINPKINSLKEVDFYHNEEYLAFNRYFKSLK